MLELIQNGGVTSPKGYIAGAISAGLKSEIGALDLAILYSEKEADLASVFTTNKIVSPSVTLSRQRSISNKSNGVVVNSGCANCAVGSHGFSDAEEMTSLAASIFNINSEKILICSTGKIGVELPMALIRKNINKIILTEEGGEDFSKAIELNPNNVDAYTNRGTAYSDLGQYQKAIDNYNKAIELDPYNQTAINNKNIWLEDHPELKS